MRFFKFIFLSIFRQKGYKKKLNTCLIFPEVLNMRKYVDGSVQNENNSFEDDDVDNVLKNDEDNNCHDNDDNKKDVENAESCADDGSNEGINSNKDIVDVPACLKSEDTVQNGAEDGSSASEKSYSCKDKKCKKYMKKEYTYNLTAVLAHKGSSANSGHYIGMS